MNWGKKQRFGKGEKDMKEKTFMDLEIQLFAEDGADAVEETNDSEVMTFDEILADKVYQSEFDKRVSKALETAKSNWEKDAEVKKTEAEKLAKMDAEEKHKYELKKAQREKEDAISKLNAYELKEVAQEIASEKGVPLSLLKVIDYTKENAESIKTKIEEIEVVYKQAVQGGINDRMKEKTPKTVVDNTTTPTKLPIMF